MIRPPPLQLKLDNRFPYPVQTPSVPKQTFLGQLYKASWKNPIIAVAGLNGLRFAYAAYNAAEDAVVDDMEGSETLLKVSIALCVMYVIASAIEIYGIIGVSLQRLSLIRAYLYLTLFASILTTGAGVLKGVSYFVFAEELMYECVSLATEGRTYEKSTFRGHIWPGSVFAVSKRFAGKFCVAAWAHHAWSVVASVFLFSLAPAMIYYVLVYTYHRQTIDPNHHANLLHQRDEQKRQRASERGAGGSRQSQYSHVGYSRIDGSNAEEAQTTGMTSSRLHAANPPSARLRATRSQVQAGRSVRGVGATSTTAASAVSSMSTTSITSKRTYQYRYLQRSHRPPPLMQSPSPLGLNPPNYQYQHGQRHNRVYAAFAAPVDDGEYDKFV